MLCCTKINSFNPFLIIIQVSHFCNTATRYRICGQTGQSEGCATPEFLYAQLVEHSDELSVERFVASDSFAQWYIYYFIVAHANHHVALSLHDGLYRPHTCTRREDTVVGAWASAALQMAED